MGPQPIFTHHAACWGLWRGSPTSGISPTPRTKGQPCSCVTFPSTPPLPSQEMEAEKQRKHEKAMAETCKVS